MNCMRETERKRGMGKNSRELWVIFEKKAGKGMCHNAIIAATATRFSRKVTRVQVIKSLLFPSIRVH